jgi:phosphoribosyl-AMP cyclohydrolase
MLAWMNREAVTATLATGQAHFYSRSRQAQWRKGESSGQVQQVNEIRLDCDGDALLLIVEQTGVACHTGRRSCWFNTVREGRIAVISEPDVDPAKLYGA